MIELLDTIIVETTAVGTVSIAIFGAAFCLMQTCHSRVSRSFALFLMAIAINSVPDALTQVLEPLPDRYALIVDLVFWPSSFLLAPLFWLYVFLLTSSEQEKPTRLTRHFVLPAVSLVVAAMLLAGPATTLESLSSDDQELSSALGTVLLVLMALLQIAVFPQIAFYLIIIVRRLSRFRLKLRDYYSSTEEYELRWIYVIGSLGFAFWLAMTLLLLGVLGFDEPPLSLVILASFAGFVLVVAITLWGIRQSPPLAPDTADAPQSKYTPPSGKYEKSALNSEAAERLSRKLRTAMEVDHLHRDANLSLWALARHIGASSNYISQTLNEVIGESFFDFVNSYRVAEAKTLLATTNESVLNITYDVGFNARSSFYNAFKRHTGQTPTSYRKNMSKRDGLDDINRQVSNT